MQIINKQINIIIKLVKLSLKIKFLVLRKYIYKNISSFGDLIHRVHPLAGQGFNMTIIKSLSKILDDNIKIK